MLQACYLLQMLPVTDVSPCYRCVPLLQMCHPVTDVFPCYRCVTCHKCVTCYRYVPLLQMCFPVTDVLFSTVHKAKGLEFSTVKITDDFVDLYNTLRNRFSRYPSCRLSPWYNRTGWLGIKHQLTYLLTYLLLPASQPCPEFSFGVTPGQLGPGSWRTSCMIKNRTGVYGAGIGKMGNWDKWERKGFDVTSA